MQPVSAQQETPVGQEVDESTFGKRAPLCGFATVLFTYFSTQWTEGQVTLAFYRSLVACDPPVPEFYNMTDNETGENVQVCCSCPGEGLRYDDVEGVCLPPAPDHANWTTSGRCHDESYVVGEAQKVIGATTTGTNLVAALSTIFFATTLIDMWGRKPMLILCFLAQALEGLCYTAVTQIGADLAQASLLIWMTVGISAVLDTSLATGNAMAADGTLPDSPERFFGMKLFTIVMAGALMVAYTSDVVILGFKLEDYSAVWPFYAAFVFCEMALAYFLLIETKPTTNQFSEMTHLQAFANAKNEILAAFKIATSDGKVFLGLMFTGIVTSTFQLMLITFPAWTRLVLDMSQQQTAVVPLYFNVIWVLSLMFSQAFARCFGNIKAFYFGIFWISVGMAFLAGNEIMFWIGMGLMPFGAGIEMPALATILTSRIAAKDMGKYFAIKGLVEKLMGSVFIYTVTNVYLGDPDDGYILRMRTVWIGIAVMMASSSFLVMWAFGWNYAGAAAEPKLEGASPTDTVV